MADYVLYGLAFIGGIASHILYFSRNEHHFHGIAYLNIFLLSFIGSTIGLYKVIGFSFGAAFGATLAFALSILAGLYTSLIIYRLFLNPLNRFPGPPAARLTTLSWSASLTNSDAYKKLEALHAKHGKFVRIGSHDLSIIDPDGMEITYGPQAKASKASWYDGSVPLTSMHTSRSRALHDRRRKVWAERARVCLLIIDEM
jgi:hypothetical protein